MFFRLSKEELPSGPLDRYMRDVHAVSNSEQTFEEFKEEWEKNYDSHVRDQNKNHPVEFAKRIKLDQYRSVTLFKRRGLGWSCSECDMAPNGGAGTIPLQTALDKAGSLLTPEERATIASL